VTGDDEEVSEVATRQKKNEPESGVVSRLSRRGEEAVTRLLDELGRNDRLTDTLQRAMSAKGKLDSAGKSALGQIGLAALDDVNDLRKQVERLEKRVAALEGATGTTASAKRSETKKAASAKRRTTTSKKAEEKAPSPPAGRALGGGAGRGSSPGGGTSSR
jgi:hypothetical protein